MADEKHDKQDDILEEAAAAAEEADDVDGYYEIDETEEGVFLTVFPPKGKGFPVNHTKVENELDMLGVQDVDLVKVSEVVAHKNTEKVLIAPPQENKDQDATFEVIIDEDKMSASITVTASQGEGKEATPEDVISALKEAGVVHGIDEKAIKEMLDHDTFDESVKVASATEPKTGEEGRVDYQFRTEKAESTPTELEDGSIDFFNLDLVENVIEGQVVAIKIDPQEGTPGANVLGEEIPAEPGKPVEFLLGKNVQVSEEDESLVIATISGQAMLADRRITVTEVYMVKGDVDYSTGNVTFVGCVKIGGNVRSGFEVKAGDSIEINGIVENAKIEAGADISIRGGIYGQETGLVEAEGDIKVKFIESATVKSKGSVIVNQAIMNSNVLAEKKVAVGGKGVLVGGMTRAGEEVKAKVLGSKLAVGTEIEVGINPMLKEEYYNLQETIKKTKQNHDKVNKGLTTLNRLKETMKDKFPPEKLAMIEKLREAKEQLNSTLEASESRFEELEKRMSQMRGGRIIVGEMIHAGVKLTIGKSVRRFDEEVKNLRNNIFREKSGEIILI